MARLALPPRSLPGIPSQLPPQCIPRAPAWAERSRPLAPRGALRGPPARPKLSRGRHAHSRPAVLVLAQGAIPGALGGRGIAEDTEEGRGIAEEALLRDGFVLLRNPRDLPQAWAHSLLPGCHAGPALLLPTPQGHPRGSPGAGAEAEALPSLLLSTRPDASWQLASGDLHLGTPSPPALTALRPAPHDPAAPPPPKDPGCAHASGAPVPLACPPPGSVSVWVFPRSHWGVADWLHASRCHLPRPGSDTPVQGQEEEQARLPLPAPAELPHARPCLVHLGPLDVLLLHPWTLVSLQPLPGALPASLAAQAAQAQSFFLPGSPSAPAAHPTAAELLWRAWPSPLRCRAGVGGPGAGEQGCPVVLDLEEVLALDREARTAQEGNWAVPLARAPGVGGDPEDPSGPLGSLGSLGVLGGAAAPAHILARDLVSWGLCQDIHRRLHSQQWGQATSLLWQVVGLCPRDPLLFFLLGWCLVKTAPAGQIKGRAGRKCWLEDSERCLLRAQELEPSWVLPSCALVHSLVAMGRGRELEAGALTSEIAWALRDTEAQSDSPGDLICRLESSGHLGDPAWPPSAVAMLLGALKEAEAVKNCL